MSLLLYGWGSNLHGQLRQPFTITKCEQPVYIDNADAIIGATGSQIFISAGQQSLYYGLTIDDDDWTSEPNQHLVAWKAPRSLLGGDELQSIIDKNGHLCVGIEGIPQTNQTWRDAAMDMTGRVVAITDLGEAFLYPTHESFVSGQHAQLLYEQEPHDCPNFDKVAAGGAHFVLLARDSSSPLYVMGDNRFGQLGDMECSTQEGHLLEMTFFSKKEGFPSSIKSISCGYRHSIALTSDGDAYLWGWVQNEDDPVFGPTPIDIDEASDELPHLLEVACAAETSLLLLQDGSVWIVGEKGTMKARHIQLPKPAFQIAAAQWSYYALTQA